MRKLIAMLLALAFVACGESPTSPQNGTLHTYESALASGTITINTGPGFRVTGTYSLDGENGPIDGAITEGRIYFLVVGFRGDTLRHVAPRGDTLRGTWERGTVVSGSWSGTGETGTFRAVHQ